MGYSPEKSLVSRAVPIKRRRMLKLICIVLIVVFCSCANGQNAGYVHRCLAAGGMQSYKIFKKCAKNIKKAQHAALVARQMQREERFKRRRDCGKRQAVWHQSGKWTCAALVGEELVACQLAAQKHCESLGSTRSGPVNLAELQRQWLQSNVLQHR